MSLKNFSPKQEIRALIANNLTLPLFIFEAIENNKKINPQTVSKAKNQLKELMSCLDKRSEK